MDPFDDPNFDPTKLSEMAIKYRERFSGLSTIFMPSMSGKKFYKLMKKALETGKEIDYIKEGWQPFPPGPGSVI